MLVLQVLTVSSSLAHATVTFTLVLGLCWLLRAAFAAHTKKKQQSRLPIENKATGKTTHGALSPLEHFEWRNKEPNQFRPFKPIYHVTMAIKSDTPSDLITIDCNYLDRIQIRKNLLSKHKDTVRGHVSTGEDSVRELYTYLMGNYLPTRYPTIFKLSDDRSSLMNLVTNDVCPTTPLSDASEALGHIGTTVEEDMFLLKPAPDGHQCVAFVCCFPSGWNPASKLGKHMTQIHSGVPGYEKISPSIERFFTKLQVGKSVHRVNWTVQTHADLFNAKSNHVREDEKVQEEDIEIEKTFLRIEFQKVNRLPESHSVLFTFKTYLYPLKQIKKEGLGDEMADAIEGLKKGNAPDMWRYKGAVRWGHRVCDYLRS